jgi:hypothetical protein
MCVIVSRSPEALYAPNSKYQSCSAGVPPAVLHLDTNMKIAGGMPVPPKPAFGEELRWNARASAHGLPTLHKPVVSVLARALECGLNLPAHFCGLQYRRM